MGRQGQREVETFSPKVFKGLSTSFPGSILTASISRGAPGFRMMSSDLKVTCILMECWPHFYRRCPLASPEKASEHTLKSKQLFLASFCLKTVCSAHSYTWAATALRLLYTFLWHKSEHNYTFQMGHLEECPPARYKESKVLCVRNELEFLEAKLFEQHLPSGAQQIKARAISPEPLTNSSLVQIQLKNK